jgi:hypothetical protein
MTRHTVFWKITKYRGSDWGENGTENLLLRKATVVLATIICERDDSAGEANTDTVPRFCFKERDHGSSVEIIDLASNSEEQPLLLGRYSLALSTPLGIYSLTLSIPLVSV